MIAQSATTVKVSFQFVILQNATPPTPCGMCLDHLRFPEMYFTETKWHIEM